MKLGGAIALGLICLAFQSSGAELPRVFEELLRTGARLTSYSLPTSIAKGGPRGANSNGTAGTCTEVGLVACDDCSTGKICYGTGQNDYRVFTCPTNTYCNVDIRGCSNTMADCSNPIDRNFNCTGAGYFPIFDGKCQEFRYCSAASSEAYPVKCPSSSRFDPKTGGCTGESIKCPNPCANKKFGFASLPEIKPFYAFCFKENDYITFKCKEGEEFVDDSCQTECTKVGQRLPKLPRKTNCKTFYQCIASSNGFKRYSQECPGNLWFNNATNICVPDKPGDC